MTKCARCKNGIFCNTWGDYKCTVTNAYICKEVNACEDFKLRTKADKVTTCQCEDCLSQGAE